MPGLFHGLEIGKQALLTHQLSMTTIGHNLANVNTPGYSRQRVTVTSAMPIEMAKFNIGSGVTAKTITHVRDLFLTNQYRRESKSLGEWTYKEKSLSQIESFFAEPSDNSLGSALNNFWESWSSLAAGDADSSTPRNQIVASARTLINSFRILDRQVTELISSTDNDIVNRVEQLGQFAKQIANLNRLIASEELGGQKANDLRDQRDYLVDELSKLVDVATREEKNGTISVFISGLAIVENADTYELEIRKLSKDNIVISEIVWEGTSTAVKLKGGELKGLIDVRDTIAPRYRNRLDDLAQTLVTELNAIHRAGTDVYGDTGYNFFNPLFTTAGTIRIDNSITLDSGRIAASLSGEIGDNANALAIYDIRNGLVGALGNASITEYYNSTVGMVGVETHEAKTFKSNFEVLMQQITNSRESVQGVSLDEEMANLVKMQHAYNAAARIITTMDEALGTVIQGMGVVGRS
ncbi:MAG: flagellar hook-associated protein FlgK [candidate division Zixibacteria bacterium]